MRRRAFLAGAAAALAARSALADAAKVFRDYDQAALDAAYDQAKYAPNLQQVVRRYATNSELARARLGAPRRVAYGPQPIEQLDIYRTQRANAPVHVFLHGGAWRSGMAKDYAFPAEMFVQYGLDFQAQSEKPVFALGFTNGVHGYVPTAADYPYGGYEVNNAHRYYGLLMFSPACERLIRQAVYELLGIEKPDWTPYTV